MLKMREPLKDGRGQCAVVLIALLLWSFALACSGGGGAQLPPTPPVASAPPPPEDDPPSTMEPTEEQTPEEFEALRASFRETYEHLGRPWVSVERAQRPPQPHEDYLNEDNSPLNIIKADYAYARGASGADITVGVIASSNFFEGHVEFDVQGKFHPDSTFQSSHEYTDDLARSHGTVMASIIAGERQTKWRKELLAPNAGEVGMNFEGESEFASASGCFDGIGSVLCSDGGGMHGVAHSAQLLTLSSESSTSPESYQFMIDRVKIVKAPLGDETQIPQNSEEHLRSTYPELIETLAQADTAPADRTIFVRGAGYRDFDSTAEIRGLADWPAYLNELQDYHHISVVGVVTIGNSDGQFRLVSSGVTCAEMAKWCLAAPYWFGAAAYDEPHPKEAKFLYNRGLGGTSLSASLVAGGLALMMEWFQDQLGTDELVKRMLATADKAGIYADESIYGQGLLDLDAATRNVGEMELPVSTAFTGPRVAAALSSFASAPAFGNAFAHGLAGLQVAALDEMDAPFFLDFASFVQPARTANALGARVFHFGRDPRGANWRTPFSFLGGETTLRASFVNRASAGDDDSPADTHVQSFSLAANFGEARGFFAFRENTAWNFGLHAAGVLAPQNLTDAHAFTAPWLALAQDGVALGLEAPLGEGALRFAAFTGDAQTESMRSDGALFEYAREHFTFQAGAVREAARALGASARGAFGELRGATAFTGATAHWPLGQNTHAFASAHAGYTRVRAARSLNLVEDVTSLLSTTFGIGLAHKNWLRSDDQLTLTLTQPLRVEHGHAHLHWATGRTRYRELTHARHALALSPTGRQLDLTLHYSRPFARARGQLTLATTATRHPRHNASATPEYTLLLRYARDF